MEIRVCRDGMMLGVYSLEEAQRALDDGELFANDLAWHQGAPDWQPLCDVPGISIFKNSKTAAANREPASDQPPPLPPNLPNAAPRVAGFWLRFFSGLLDCVIVSVISEPLLELFTHEKMAAMTKTAMTILNLEAQLSRASDIDVYFDTASQISQHLSLLLQQSTPLLLLSLILAWFYFAGLNALPWQTTPGKWLLRLKLVTTGGGRVGFWRSTVRYIGSVFMIGYLLLPFSRKKQSLQDRFAQTLVVHR